MGEFDGKSMADLHTMLAGSDATRLTETGQALGKAGPLITAIGEGVKRYASRVEWKGRANDSFREWAHDFSLEVLRLAELTDAVGTQIAEAGNALAFAKKAIPAPIDARQAHGDPDLDDALEAEAAKLNEAVHEMEKLSSAYTVSRETMAAQREPRFAALPETRYGDSMERPYESAPRTSPLSGAAHAGPEVLHGTVPGSSGTQSPLPVPPGPEDTTPPGRASTSTVIDSVAAEPQEERTRPPTAPPTSVEGTDRLGSPPTDPVSAPRHDGRVPRAHRQGPAAQRIHHERTSATRVPTVNSPHPQAPISGGRTRPIGETAPARGMPRATVIGEGAPSVQRGMTPGVGMGGSPVAGNRMPGGGVPTQRRAATQPGALGAPRPSGQTQRSVPALGGGVGAGRTSAPRPRAGDDRTVPDGSSDSRRASGQRRALAEPVATGGPEATGDWRPFTTGGSGLARASQEADGTTAEE